MPKVTQFTLTLQSKPGVLAQVCSTLAKAGVNITALCAPEVRGKGKVRIMVGDLPRARQVLKAAKLRFGEEEAVVVTLEDRPGALADAAERLSRAKVNVKCAYATTAGTGGPATVVLTVSNVAKAVSILG